MIGEIFIVECLDEIFALAAEAPPPLRAIGRGLRDHREPFIRRVNGVLIPAGAYPAVAARVDEAEVLAAIAIVAFLDGRLEIGDVERAVARLRRAFIAVMATPVARLLEEASWTTR